MGRFSQLFNRIPTAYPQDLEHQHIVNLQADVRANTRKISQLVEDLDDLAEKTSRKLKRYAAWAQPRKDGKFGSQEPSESDNDSSLIQGYGSVPTPSHEQIQAMARERSLIK